MNKSINLLTNREKNNAGRILHTLFFLRAVAVTILFLVSVSSVILFILISLSPLPKLKNIESATRATLAAYHTDMARLQVVNERLDTISQIISTRPAFNKKLDLILQKMPPELSIITFAIDKKTLNLTVSSKSLGTLETFIHNLRSSAEEKKDFSRIILNNLVKDKEDNTFLLSVSLTTYE